MIHARPPAATSAPMNSPDGTPKAPIFENRCSSLRRSGCMLGRWVQNTNAAINTATSE